MKKMFTLLCVHFYLFATAQSVSIGSAVPDESAMLDINAANKGLLVPRVAITSLSSNSFPINNPAIGLIVYNTNPSIFTSPILDQNAAGFYFWTGSIWEKIASSTKGAVPIGGIIEFENKITVPGYTYIGYNILSDYYEKIGTGFGSWDAIPNISTNQYTTKASYAYYNNKFFVWSGEDNTYLSYDNTGAYYVPALNTWTNMETLNAPVGRYGNVTAIDQVSGWMLVWGGVTARNAAGAETSITNTGGTFDLLYNSWSAMPNGPLAARTGHTAVWGNGTMIIWGGHNPNLPANYNDGAAYYRPTQTWTAIAACPLAARYNHSAIWTSTNKMIIWGGTNGTTIFSDGAAYDPVANTWSLIASNPFAPFNALQGHTATYTGTDMIVFGGKSNFGISSYCSKYNIASNTWSSVPAAPGSGLAATGAENHIAIWTGTEMVIIGGKNTFNSGGAAIVRAFNPATNTWRLYNDLPSARFGLAGVWTGTQIIVQGGAYSGYNNGYKFDPNTGTTSDIHVSAGRLLFKYRKD